MEEWRCGGMEVWRDGGVEGWRCGGEGGTEDQLDWKIKAPGRVKETDSAVAAGERLSTVTTN
jgi:hypothetical protein